jgi:transcriptional regulator with XRE-family HTH domain
MGQTVAGPFAQALRRCRLAAGLSQEELAERAGLSVDGVSALERGHRTSPRPAAVRLLADAAGPDAARADLAAAVARAGVDPTAQPRQLQDALKAAIADRRGYVDWDVDHAGWVVESLRPERETFRGRTPEEALAWCLVWLMVEELEVGPPA